MTLKAAGALLGDQHAAAGVLGMAPALGANEGQLPQPQNSRIGADLVLQPLLIFTLFLQGDHLRDPDAGFWFRHGCFLICGGYAPSAKEKDAGKHRRPVNG